MAKFRERASNKCYGYIQLNKKVKHDRISVGFTMQKDVLDDGIGTTPRGGQHAKH
ncbi:hypothetical protein LJC64_02905 [Ruminococcaceae bacterium OttesenSCG-928-A11]|nr:hypothetical protein [Ruminococcaceae bacterium OttesenSCG-928-A11]